MLKLIDIHAYYGQIHALKGISLEVPEKSIVSLLGANGAGKSTTLKVISRLINPRRGNLELNNQSLMKKSYSRIVKEGIIHCPENRRIFPLLTVEENLKIGAFTRKDRPKIKEDLEKIYNYFPRLKERINQKAGTLSGGEQQMLAIGRSLMANPKILLLDEPSLGIAPKLVQEIFKIILEVNKQGTSVLLVEQNANMALRISNYTYVLENGKVALEGKSDELINNKEVQLLYLGG